MCGRNTYFRINRFPFSIELASESDFVVFSCSIRKKFESNIIQIPIYAYLYFQEHVLRFLRYYLGFFFNGDWSNNSCCAWKRTEVLLGGASVEFFNPYPKFSFSVLSAGLDVPTYAGCISLNYFFNQFIVRSFIVTSIY